MALNNGRKPQCKTAVNWLLNALTNIVQKKMMQYFLEIQVFVCCYEVGFSLALQFNFSVKRQ
jgi:hypothetical protein